MIKSRFEKYCAWRKRDQGKIGKRCVFDRRLKGMGMVSGLVLRHCAALRTMDEAWAKRAKESVLSPDGAARPRSDFIACYSTAPYAKLHRH
jgi:hypothetical protein